MRTINRDSRVCRLVMTAMMMCIIMVSVLLLRIPIPFTQGFVNLSDAMVFMAVIVLGWRYGTVAAGLGSMLGDLVAGFAIWAPWTLGIKAAMAVIFGLILESALCRRKVSGRGFLSLEIVGMFLAGLFMTAGYYFAEGVMYGTWVVAALGIPWNIAQFMVGMVLAIVLNRALAKTTLRTMMAYAAPVRLRTMHRS